MQIVCSSQTKSPQVKSNRGGGRQESGCKQEQVTRHLSQASLSEVMLAHVVIDQLLGEVLEGGLASELVLQY